MWGSLLWLRMDELCSSVLVDHFPQIFTFHHVATVGNAVMFGFMSLHEGYLGEKFGDLTLRPEQTPEGVYTYEPPETTKPGTFSDVQDVPASSTSSPSSPVHMPGFINDPE